MINTKLKYQNLKDIMLGYLKTQYSLFSPYSQLINMAEPGTIEDRAINMAKNGKISFIEKHENLTLAINSAKVT